MAKDDKVYEENELDLDVRHGSRDELRKSVVNAFLAEQPGYWKDEVKHVTRYKYFVEKLSDGRRVFLYRPTFLNKGIDFQVWVERFKDGEDKKPSHKDMLGDLKRKKVENPKLFAQLLGAIEHVWNCEEPDEVLKHYKKLEFKQGFSPELILKVLKWLFIEQDITYWNYDGRGMLKQAIDKT